VSPGMQSPFRKVWAIAGQATKVEVPPPLMRRILLWTVCGVVALVVIWGGTRVWRFMQKTPVCDSTSPDGRFRVQVLVPSNDFDHGTVIQIMKRRANPGFLRKEWPEIRSEEIQVSGSITPNYDANWDLDGRGRSVGLTVYPSGGEGGASRHAVLQCTLDANS
jgi:hypothetical protein